MIRPEEFTVIRERTGREWNNRQVFDFGFVLPRIKPRNLPILVGLFHSTQDKDHSIDKGMSADFRSDLDRTNDLALIVILQNALLVPLAQVKMPGVVTEVGTGEVRTGENLLKPIL